MSDAATLPETVERAEFDAALGGLRAREKAHTREGDAIAAARRRLPMVEIDERESEIALDDRGQAGLRRCEGGRVDQCGGSASGTGVAVGIIQVG
jgi:hypothetical protein